MSVASQFGGGGIKSIQRGTVSVLSTATVTITAVNTAKTMLNYLGDAAGSAFLQLTSSTQITFTSGDGNFSKSVSYEVIEYF
jgi:hypothetical protein